MDTLTFSFDIGHSSIGWAAFQNPETWGTFPEVIGTGVVLFKPDGVLVSKRRQFRRARRNIASRRSRVNRLRAYVEGLGVMEKGDFSAVQLPPFVLASRVLALGKQLTWPQLYSVLRWYAHNRGYDGNELWSNDTDGGGDGAGDESDAEKVQNAKNLMAEHGTSTMAETMCKVLGIDIAGDKVSSMAYFKGHRATFERETVKAEVLRILKAHVQVLPKVTPKLIEDLLVKAPASASLPSRFKGGILFGQFVPRFDNRIIPACRITGRNTPNKSCEEFLRYRWARLLANITVFGADGTVRPLTGPERQALHAKMEENGFFTKLTLNAAIQAVTGCKPANTESYFLTEEMEEALVLDPARKALDKKLLKEKIIPLFSQKARAFALDVLRARQVFTLRKLLDYLAAIGEDTTALQAAIDECDAEEAAARRPRGKKKKESAPVSILDRSIKASYPSGRAAYCREILRKAFDEVMAGQDPASQTGCLYETEAVRERLASVPLDKQTNNHLVRHRLLIFKRLLRDMVDTYAGGDARKVRTVVVEVVSELQEFSGLNTKEMAAKLGAKMGNFKTVVAELEAETTFKVSGSLIRKARMLYDQDFTCPYTGQTLSYGQLGVDGLLDIDHIIPRSLRPSDALSSCVMTFRAVNEMKGQRTAQAFIDECGGMPVPGTNYSILTPAAYRANLDAHHGKPHSRSYPFGGEDAKRCRRQQQLLQLKQYDPRDADFLERDLTQTSFLNKLAIRLVGHELGIRAWHLPGSVTGLIRKKLSLVDCLVASVPRLQQTAQEGERLTKDDLRAQTHLHHALDAITQGLAFILFDVADWKLLVKRHLTEQDRKMLKAKYGDLMRFGKQGDFALASLPGEVRENIAQRLAEKHVVYHLPSTMDGMQVEETTWAVRGTNATTGKIELAQHSTDSKGNRYDADGHRIVKKGTEKPSLLLGYGYEGKLSSVKGVRIVSENWGAVLDPTPKVIPYVKVFPQLRAAWLANGRKPIRILRNGIIIHVANGRFKGVWRIASIKDTPGGILLDILACDRVSTQNKVSDCKINVRLDTLLRDGLTSLRTNYLGNVLSHHHD